MVQSSEHYPRSQQGRFGDFLSQESHLILIHIMTYLLLRRYTSGQKQAQEMREKLNLIIIVSIQSMELSQLEHRSEMFSNTCSIHFMATPINLSTCLFSQASLPQPSNLSPASLDQPVQPFSIASEPIQILNLNHFSFHKCIQDIPFKSLPYEKVQVFISYINLCLSPSGYCIFFIYNCLTNLLLNNKLSQNVG